MRKLLGSAAGLFLALPALGCAGLDEASDVGSDSVAIVGGAPTDGYPAVPLLYAEYADGTGQLCSGTLISPQVVLTAAHCLEFPEEPASFVAYFGSDATIENDPNHIETIAITDRVYDERWNINVPSDGYDIGLVRLATPGPVEPMGYNRDPLTGREGENVHLVGWGRTDGEGSDYGRKREVMSSLQAQNNMLMQYGSATANTCQGDSGGPNFMLKDGVEVVAGITSYGNVGCDQYGVGTNLAAYVETFVDPWIAENDPSGGCMPNSVCGQGCGAADPDCDTSGGDDTGDGDGSGDGDGTGDGDGSGDGNGAPNSDVITGGCSAGSGSGSPWLILLAAVLVAAGRRRSSR